MATLLTGQVTPSNVATPLSAVPLTPMFWSFTALASNVNTLFYGPKGVTVATGYPLPAGDSLSFDLRRTEGGIFDLSPNGLYIIGPPGGGDVAAWVAFL